MKIIVWGCASYRSMAFKWCADVIWNSLKTKTDEKFGKKEWVNQRVYGHGWRFLDCRVPRKKGNTFKLVGKKTGAKAQPRYNGFRVISVRVITALQCTFYLENKTSSGAMHFCILVRSISLQHFRVPPVIELSAGLKFYNSKASVKA